MKRLGANRARHVWECSPRAVFSIRMHVQISLLNSGSGRFRLSPVPLEKTQNRIIGLICPFFAPRIFVKCPSIKKMDGRGGGDQTKLVSSFQARIG